MSDTLKPAEEKANEIPVVANALRSPNTEPDPPCCRAPGDSDGGPDT